VALLSIGLFGARLRRRAWGGLALALGGALVLALAKGARWGTGYGEFLAALASGAYAFFTLALSRARAGISARRCLAWICVTCTVGFGLLAWLHGDPFGPFPARSWWALAGLGVVVQVLAWWLISWGLGHIDANLGSIGLMVQPVATVGLAWVFLGEHVKPVQGLGALLILSGIALSAFTPPFEPRKE
jgi:drug/metabolite transporter (DMT)-like permease